MSADRDVNRIVRSWLEEGVSALPDRVLDTVLDQLHATPQRRAPWPVRRFGEMNNFAKFAVAAAAAVVAGFVGFRLLSGPGIGPGTTPPPTPSATASATPIPLPSGSFEAGVYSWPTGDPIVPVRFSLTVPSGWRNEGWAITKSSDTAVIVSPWTVLYTYEDPCRWMTSVVDPGPSVEGLVDALRQQAGRNPSAAVPVTIDGHAGQQIELDVPADMDSSACDGREYRTWVGPGTGVTGTSVSEPSRIGLKPGLHSVVTVLDLDGTRFVIEASYPGGSSPTIRSEVLSIVESIQILP
jgi:hypothetical protein